MKIKLIIVFICLSFLACAPVFARDNILDIQKVESAGGITAWLVEDHTLPIISFDFSFKGIGSALDPLDKQGLAKLVSNTMDEGAGNLDSEAFQKHLKDLSIDLYFNSDRDNFGGSLKTLSKNKIRAFTLLKMALSMPRFDEDAVTRMKEANKSRIRSSLSDPEWMAARLINDKAYAEHPYANNSGGTLSSLDRITPEDLKNFTALLSQDRLVVSVVGDITASQLRQLLDAVFGNLPKTSAVTAIENIELKNRGNIFVYEQDIPQSIIEIMHPGIDPKDTDYHTAQIMNFVLGSSGFGSRLTEEIREKRGLTYGIHSSLIDMDHGDFLAISTSTKNENAKEILDLIHGEWAKMIESPVTAQELENAKSYLIGSLPLSLTSTDKVSSLLLSLQLSGLPINYLDQREKDIQNTTAEDVQRVSKKLLNPEHFTTVIVGQPQGLEKTNRVEALPNVE